MKSSVFIALALATSFGMGFFSNAIFSPKPIQHFSPTVQVNDEPLKRVTGVAGVFFKCKNPEKVRAWYKTHLGFETNQYGATFEWQEGPDPAKKGLLQWSPFSEKSTYFAPSTKPFMINYRVENIVALVEQLKKEGVTILDKIETYDYGKFVHIMDIEGNKIELFEPIYPVSDKAASAANPVVHFEIGCKDLAKTSTFYSSLFGWATTISGPSATISTNSTEGIQGHLTALGHEPFNYVSVYIQVDDIEQYLQKIQAAGGQKVVGPIKLPTGQQFAWFKDLEGNVLGLLTKPRS